MARTARRPNSCRRSSTTFVDRWRCSRPGFSPASFPGALREAAAALGAFIGAKGEDIAFVTNATEGCNAALRSLALRPGNEALVLTHGYGAVRNTVHYVTGRAGARMTDADLPFPDPDEARVLAALEGALTPRTRSALRVVASPADQPARLNACAVGRSRPAAA